MPYIEKIIFSTALDYVEEFDKCPNGNSCLHDIKWEIRDNLINGCDLSVDEFVGNLESHVEDCICLELTASILKFLQASH